MAEARHRSISRAELGRDQRFERLSPSLGELREDAFDEIWAADPDDGLELLAKTAQATDTELARLSRTLAGRLSLRLASADSRPAPGQGRLEAMPADQSVGDLDLDRSLDAVVAARGAGRTPDLRDLTSTHWLDADTAVCLLVDRSGSMDGTRLACAALAAAMCAWRAAERLAVLAFNDRVVELKAIDTPRRPEQVVSDLLALKGHGTTDVRLALHAAGLQFARTNAKRRITVLLSDAEATTGGDPLAAARRLDELAVVAPADEPDHATRLATGCGGRMATVTRPRSVLPALRSVMR